ncbi:hypothetical protein [Coleofasciculus chthonoplastes]|jgi:hypothetical protein|uniref:hypothetical protein n=1 Tax=Coleofasciculus chthonoplastes TaxID=64178 RepID=UPI003300496C
MSTCLHRRFLNPIPQQNPFRQTILEILANWRITVNESENLSELDQELSSAIAPMLQLPPQELTSLLITLSREQLLERLG